MPTPSLNLTRHQLDTVHIHPDSISRTLTKAALPAKMRIAAVFDHALTRPWSVDKTFRRNPNAHPNWGQTFCTEGNNQIVIGTENYFLSGEGLLMPAKKDQAPPDLRYFKQTRKQ